MAGFWHRLVHDFDLATARIEDETAEIEERTRRLNEVTGQIELTTTQIRSETDQIKKETSAMFNDAVADIGTKIENAVSAEEREMLRAQALHLYRSQSPSTEPVDTPGMAVRGAPRNSRETRPSI